MSFDVRFPPSTAIGTILDALPGELAERCSCREDWEKFERAMGAINLLRTQLDRGFISMEHARECAKELWGTSEDDGSED